MVIAALLFTAAAVRIHDDDQNNLSQSLLTSNSDTDGIQDRSDNQYDSEIKTSLTQVGRNIHDADNDSVEDNVLKNQDELDRFRKKVFGPNMEDMHNTYNG